jgi:hypothetical protein
MLKFLKIVLFLVVVAFSFALGLKFSDSDAFKSFKKSGGAQQDIAGEPANVGDDNEDTAEIPAKQQVEQSSESQTTEVVDIVTEPNQNNSDVIFEAPVANESEPQFQPMQIDGYDPSQVEVSDEVSIDGQPVVDVKIEEQVTQQPQPIDATQLQPVTPEVPVNIPEPAQIEVPKAEVPQQKQPAAPTKKKK